MILKIGGVSIEQVEEILGGMPKPGDNVLFAIEVNVVDIFPPREGIHGRDTLLTGNIVTVRKAVERDEL